MTRYIAARLLAAVPVLFVISLLAFGLEAITPGDPATLLLQAAGIETITPEAVHLKRAELHLDDPLVVRYLDWLRNATHGDFGRSFRSYTPVATIYRQRIGNTALLAGCAVAARRAGRDPPRLRGCLPSRRAARCVRAVRRGARRGSARLLDRAGLHLRLLGASALAPGLRDADATGHHHSRDCPRAPNIAILTRLTRAAILDILNNEFVTVARAKGLSPRIVTRTHVLPNVVVPILTVLGLEAAHLMTGAAVVEYVFAWPGIGKMAVDAALLRDTPVIVGFAIAAGLIFVVANLDGRCRDCGASTLVYGASNGNDRHARNGERADGAAPPPYSLPDQPYRHCGHRHVALIVPPRFSGRESGHEAHWCRMWGAAAKPDPSHIHSARTNSGGTSSPDC